MGGRGCERGGECRLFADAGSDVDEEERVLVQPRHLQRCPRLPLKLHLSPAPRDPSSPLKARDPSSPLKTPPGLMQRHAGHVIAHRDSVAVTILASLLAFFPSSSLPPLLFFTSPRHSLSSSCQCSPHTHHLSHTLQSAHFLLLNAPARSRRQTRWCCWRREEGGCPRSERAQRR